MPTQFKEYFVTMNEDHTSINLYGIYYGITIQCTGTVKYVMLDDTGKPYTMIVEAYWVPELRHQLVSLQDLHTEEGNTMSFQHHSGFEGEDRFSELIVKTKLKGYHRPLALQTTTMQYNHRNNLPIHSAQLPHDQKWTASVLEAAICETINNYNNLTVAHRELLQWNFRIIPIGFIHVNFLARTRQLSVNNPKAVANCYNVKFASCQFEKASHQPTKNSDSC